MTDCHIHGQTLETIKLHVIKGNILGFDFTGTAVAASQENMYKTGNALFGTMPESPKLVPPTKLLW